MQKIAIRGANRSWLQCSILIIKKYRELIGVILGEEQLIIAYKFHNPIFYGEEHKAEVVKTSMEKVKLNIKSLESGSQKISLEIRKKSTINVSERGFKAKEEWGKKSILNNNESTLCEILMHSSYIVGVENPGENSIYIDGTIECKTSDLFENQKEKIETETCLRKQNGMIRSNETRTNNGVRHKFNAVVRPEFKDENEMTINYSDENCAKIEKIKEVPQHIIIGGSSGLGRTLITILKDLRHDYSYTSRHRQEDPHGIEIENLGEMSLNPY